MTYSDFLDVPEWYHGVDEDATHSEPSSPTSLYSAESEGSAESATFSSETEDRSDSARPWKWLTISTIRHAQSMENVQGHKASLTDAMNATDPLTDLGVHQATVLAKQWTNVRISCIYTSPYTRAFDSALTLLRHHHTTTKSASPNPHCHSRTRSHVRPSPRRPSVHIHPQLIERKSGTHALSYLARGDARGYRAARDGFCDEFPAGSRDWVPEGGGESRNMVNMRAESVLMDLLRKWAVEDESIPVEVLRCSSGGEERDVHPEEALLNGVPHVVVVSHNIFLRALDESIRRCTWGPTGVGKVSYPNTGWGRYLIRYRESDGGIQLIARPLRVPMSC